MSRYKDNLKKGQIFVAIDKELAKIIDSKIYGTNRMISSLVIAKILNKVCDNKKIIMNSIFEANETRIDREKENNI